MATAIQVILQEDVPKLGQAGELVKVKPGYARNFLLPQGMAFFADARALEFYAKKKAQLEQVAESKRDDAETAKTKLEDKKFITVRARTGEKGKLFGAITKEDIANAIKDQANVVVDKHRVKVPSAIKAIGEYEITIGLGSGVEAQVSLKVETLN